MDSSTENRKDPCLIKTLTTSDFEVLSSKISSTGFRVAKRDFKSWAKKMEALHESIWRKAGIFEAIKASSYKIPTNPSLILALVEKWCPETNSFVFPWGEATITLEDVRVLLGFSVSGSSVSAPLESSVMRAAVAKLEGVRVEYRSRDGRVSQKSWISSFRNIDDYVDGDDDKIEHEAFLTVWLSEFVFPDAWCRSISGKALPIAVRLARGDKIALAPAVLASLYRDLTRIHGFGRCESIKRIKLKSLLKLVQVWIWERFSNIRPKEAREIQMGEPRIARWCFRKKRCEKNNERLSFDGFEWRPYAKSLKNWSPPKFYAEEGKWMSVNDSLDDEFVSFARCLRVSRLVGIGFVEDYYPNRVAMQFGFDQDLPGLATHLSDNKKEKEAWDDYNKSLDGLKLYIPSRLARGSVTKRYQDWWFKSVSESLLSSEENDNDDVSPKVQRLGEWLLKRCRKAKNVRTERKKGKRGDWGGSISKEVTLSELFHKKLMKRTSVHLRNKRRKRACEKDDDDDNNITMAEMVNSRKKTEGDTSESLGKRSRLDDEVYVRFDVKKGIGKIGDSGGSTSREMPLSELFQELAKRTSDHLRNKQACEEEDDDGNITIAEMDKSRKKTKGDASESLEENNKLDSRDETVAIQEIEPRIVQETGIEAEKITVLAPNSSDPPLVASNGGIVVSPQEDKSMIDVGTKKEECLYHENGEKEIEKKLCSEVKTEEEEIDERLKQRKLVIEELALKLEARMVKVEKSLAMIRDWKTKRNQNQNLKVSA